MSWYSGKHELTAPRSTASRWLEKNLYSTPNEYSVHIRATS